MNADSLRDVLDVCRCFGERRDRQTPRNVEGCGKHLNGTAKAGTAQRRTKEYMDRAVERQGGANETDFRGRTSSKGTRETAGQMDEEVLGDDDHLYEEDFDNRTLDVCTHEFKLKNRQLDPAGNNRAIRLRNGVRVHQAHESSSTQPTIEIDSFSMSTARYEVPNANSFRAGWLGMCLQLGRI